MKKLLSTALLNHDQAVCPHCDTKIGLGQISEYFLKGTDHGISCPKCNRILHPKREPIKFYYCFCAGFISIVAPFWLYIWYVEDNFWKAILSSLATLIICIIVICILTIRRIEFK